MRSACAVGLSVYCGMRQNDDLKSCGTETQCANRLFALDTSNNMDETLINKNAAIECALIPHKHHDLSLFYYLFTFPSGKIDFSNSLVGAEELHFR